MGEKPIEILIADNNPEYFEKLNEDIHKDGKTRYRLEHANSYEMAKVKTTEKNFDAIMMDITKIENGLDYICRIQKLAPAVPIIVISTSKDEEISISAIRRGVQEFLFKGGLDNALLFRSVRHSIERNLLREKLESLNTLKDEFLSIVSHDIRSPLGVIQSTMDLLLDGDLGEINDEQKEFIVRCQRQSENVLELITDLLDLGKIEHGFELHHETFNLRELVELCMDNFSLKMKEKKITCQSSFQKDFQIYADPARISQVVNNLISNATKFTPEGGEIKITVSTFKGRRLTDHHESIVRIAISDTGPGIPKDHLEKIFDKYEQVRRKDAKIGTGLGLAICKQICKLHKGNIWPESELGKGTTFFVFLPHVIEAQAEGQKESKSNDQVHLLIMGETDQETLDRKKALESLKFKVYDVCNPRDALKQIKTKRPDLVLVQLESNLQDIIDGLQKIRSDQDIGEIPLIVVTSAEEQTNVEDYYRYANDLIYIPTNDSEFEFKIRKALNLANDPTKGQVLDPSKKTVLIVEDEDKERNQLNAIIAALEYNTLVAKNGIEGLFMFKKYHIDLVVSDISMPVMDGIELAEHLKSSKHNVPIIFYTGHRTKAYEKASKHFGSYEFFAKPFDALLIKKTLSKALSSTLEKK